MTIHWCGTGLSAIPGLRHLIVAGRDVCVWNRTVEKAKAALEGLEVEINAMDRESLANRLRVGDVVVSMLPGDHHVPLARMAIEKGAHFVSSSYIAPQMQALDAMAKDAGLILVNEIGLDPGIDHLMAHWLVADYRASDAYDAGLDLTFLSYCGGLPKIPNDFCYKFSWSPAGVLRALKSPSKSIKDFKTLDVSKPWEGLSTYHAPLSAPEAFEVYPNRDSRPFMEQYGFDLAWKVKTFVRGTLRPKGWSTAWSDIFETLDKAESEEAKEAKIVALSDELWQVYAYDAGEPDRVVLCVELKAELGDELRYHKAYVLDAHGDERASAMARLVSYPVAKAVESILDGRYRAGLHAASDDPEMIDDFLDIVRENAQYLEIVDLKEC